MENNLRILFAPIGLMLFFVFFMAGMLLASLSLIIGAITFIKCQLALSARIVLFS